MRRVDTDQFMHFYLFIFNLELMLENQVLILYLVSYLESVV